MLADDQAHYVISKLSTVQTRVSTKGGTKLQLNVNMYLLTHSNFIVGLNTTYFFFFLKIKVFYTIPCHELYGQHWDLPHTIITSNQRGFAQVTKPYSNSIESFNIPHIIVTYRPTQ